MTAAKFLSSQAGTVILCVTLVLWVLSHVPFHTDLPQSIIGHIGQWIEPVIKPLGFNWKIGIGLLSSVVAREVIVGTLGTLYGADPATQSLSLQAALRHDLTLGGAMALVVFLRFCHAVHFDAGDCKARDEQLEVARSAVHLHDRAGIRGRAGHQRIGFALFLVN